MKVCRPILFLQLLLRQLRLSALNAMLAMHVASCCSVTKPLSSTRQLSLERMEPLHVALNIRSCSTVNTLDVRSHFFCISSCVVCMRCCVPASFVSIAGSFLPGLSLSHCAQKTLHAITCAQKQGLLPCPLRKEKLGAIDYTKKAPFALPIEQRNITRHLMY